MRVLVAALALSVLACASAPARRGAPPPPSDRTNDPEFLAALRAAERDFENQADALAAGIYEPFVHPDSLLSAPAQAPPTRPDAAVPPVEFGPDDPTTETLLGTLPPNPLYNRTGGDSTRGEDPNPQAIDKVWTLQVGAFGEETGALVRLRQLERDFPEWPRWNVADRGVFRVYVGRFISRGSAERARAEVADRGYGDAWIVPAP